MGSIQQTMGQAWKVGTQNRNLGDREVPREKQPLHSLQGKIQCEMSCPLLFCNYRTGNIFIMREKGKKENLPAFWLQATEHGLPIAPSCGNTYYYPIQGVGGQATLQPPPPKILVTLNLRIQLKSCTQESEKPWGWGGKKMGQDWGLRNR